MLMQTTSSLIFSSEIATLEIYCNGRNIPARKSSEMSGDLHGFQFNILHVLVRKRRISTFFFLCVRSVFFTQTSAVLLPEFDCLIVLELVFSGYFIFA